MSPQVGQFYWPKGGQIYWPLTALPTGHVALHADVFCLDNSKTRKEGVARTYHGYDGYAPIGAYLGEEGWCVGLELRPGDQHSQKDFLFFLDRCPPWRAKRRRVVPGSREATRDTRRAEGAKGDPKGASERGVQSYGRPVCSRNELAMLWRNAG